MVFPGRYSTGCQRCRQRKIKCDETRPSCRRCYLYGKPCPGYSDQFHFRIHAASSKVTTPPKEELPDTQQPRRRSTSQQKDATGVVVKNSGTQVSLAPSLAISYDEVSLCYFIRRFVTPCEAKDNFPGHLSFLPSLYRHHDHGILELATLAVAQMAAFNQFGGNTFRLQSYQNYGRTVAVLRNCIQNEIDITDDRVLASVILLCLFKDISGEDWGDPCEHASGLYYLLERRGIEQLCTNRGFELFMLALIKLQVYSFLRGDDRYGDPGSLVASLSVFDPMMRAMSLMTRSVSLRRSLMMCEEVTSAPEGQDEAGCLSSDHLDNTAHESSILLECFKALDEFDSWDAEAGAYWKQIFESRGAPPGLGEVATKGGFYDPETACTIILVRSARLVLLLSILEYWQRAIGLNVTEEGACSKSVVSAELVSFLEQNTRSTIDDMVSLVPFALGDVDSDGKAVSLPHEGAPALIILQPMRLVTYCPYATDQQRAYGRHILDRLNLGIGVRSAVSWEQTRFNTVRHPEGPLETGASTPLVSSCDIMT
ncbi:hypothetical protein PFICI_12725 [Pestalotiopsis fici W106-1]|uniref:Zn(2)-C6 fungal-type domain-containing protein n=1 Tax=Pestalotiopsis fici (strain W106-1 / CGMCC3.15140) TaxID=1229662 RepID=W3WSH9_PESFW|nr:uncharacterized protein PFICI_12725 [Pestalotiopsis fici W106-1]ETS75781.1 hypothetical protein PFICI_12725 [Pestalotiopsis fici W106-1]